MSIFSIIIPAYNRKTLICEALDSVWQQTYRPIEVVVVDDGSTDATAEVVKDWGIHHFASDGGDPEPKSMVSVTVEAVSCQSSVIKNQLSSSWEIGDDQFKVRYFYQENAGAGAARNRGIKEMCGKYVQFLDSDDRLHPERLERLVDTFENEKCDFIQTGFEGFDADTGEIIQTAYGKPDKNQVELVLQGQFWANTLRAALTAELVRSIGPWNIEMTCFEDREYMERAVVAANKPAAIRDVLASARRGGSSRISDKLRSYEGRTWRVYCERCLAEATRDRDDLSYEAKQEFASRIYALGFRSNACGWKDLGKQCGEIVASMNVKLDGLGRRRKLVWRMGSIGGLVYGGLAKIKQ